MTEFSYKELQILHYLKRRRGVMVHRPPFRPGQREGIVNTLAEALDIKQTTIGYVLRRLEERCLVIRSYLRPKAGGFRDGTGYNPITRLELVDPTMDLPPLPQPPLGVVVARENRELAERVAPNHDPTVEQALLAVLDRNDELQKQLDRLREIVDAQAKDNITLREEVERLRRPPVKHVSEGLQERVRGALTEEQWEQLRHSPKD